MPNAAVLKEKQEIVAQLAEKMKSASAGVLVDYKGISVANDTNCVEISETPGLNTVL